MMILDKPYVSKFLEDSLIEMQIPVLKNKALEELNLSSKILTIDEEEFIKRVKNSQIPHIFSNSENSINWIKENLSFTDLPNKISIFKDKVEFRKIMKPFYPNYYFQKVNFNELGKIDVSKMQFPFIIKPAVGFFSLGVYLIKNLEEWPKIIKFIQRDMNNINKIFPIEVIDSSSFIIEENIEGEEYAVDVYFNSNGRPVILNILKHYFASPEDTSDRLYITSKNIIEESREIFLETLEKISQATQIRNFPMHIEFRVDENNNIGIIEANPMRFAGLCVTDLAYYAWRTNNYKLFFEQEAPDWNQILKDKEGKIFAMIVGNIPADINLRDIKSVDYEKFAKKFKKPLDIRKINYHEFPLFAIAFAEFDENNLAEMNEFLNDDFKDIISL
ncbi:ATP-grasp domain-containing protein [Promethearchaeum syntrophicum]|uniref:ATP-grasp domain-containing protein n=1 Tax=Promethearchaeum syntrophicum TaxID=2594042 RepID=A0A5B9D7U3_9ARCH|nr:ATP-grasp domain-containing protein [Candidatus Prometheoarchaeum syntrophicum]QEE15113.1 carbamoyl phosphate synthase-like protein [Candidatus Prometheoarchaeum syntrophicum]